MRYTLREAKARLSSLLDAAAAGEAVEIARHGPKGGRFRIVLVEEGRPVRRLGTLKGRIWVPPDFDDEDPEITAAFEGE